MKKKFLFKAKSTSIKFILSFLMIFSFSKTLAEENFQAAKEFTINYENVSILQYVQFVSKVCKVNFIYNDQDLNFNVSIISKEPISKDSIMSSLAQVLKINGLNIVEDEGNLIITKSNDIKALSPLYSENKELKDPIITRIFPIKNSSLAAISTIIKPMISQDAFFEILIGERQLIVTDIKTNIFKIEELVQSLDSLKNPLVIEPYKIKESSSSVLINLTKEIIAPFIASNPYFLVPQDSTNTIFLVTTPALAKKTITILESIDVPAQGEIKTLDNQSIFIYTPINRSFLNLKNALNDIIKNLKNEGFDHQPLIDTISNMKWLPETGSVIFIAQKETIEKLKTLLLSLDSRVEKILPSYFLYKLTYANGSQIEEDLDAFSKNLQSQKSVDPSLIETIESAKWIKETNSILLTGSPNAIEEVKNIIAQYDIIKRVEPKANFFTFVPKVVTLDETIDYLNNVAKNLEDSGLSDPNLLESIQNLKTVPANNTILFTGNVTTLEKIKSLLDNFDISKKVQEKGNFLIFNPKNSSLEELKTSIKEIANNLKSSGLVDRSLLESLNSVKTNQSTNSIIFTGSPDTLTKIKELLVSVDQPLSKQTIQQLGKTSFWVYKILKSKPQHLISSIKSITSDLEKIDSTDPNFLSALKSLRYVKETNSLVFTGNQSALEKIEPLIQKFDIEIADLKDGTSTKYFVYKPKYLTGEEIEHIFQDFAENLKTTTLDNNPLYEAIESIKWSSQTNTLVFTGEAAAIEEIKQLLLIYDIADKDHLKSQDISGLEDLGFLVYKLQYHKGDEIQTALKQIATDLKATSTEDSTKSTLVKAIDAIQWIKITNSLLCSGDKDTLSKLKELINSLDVPLKQVFIEVLVIQTTLNNALSFGLDWGSKFQYKNQAVVGAGNFSTPDTSSSGGATINPFATTMNTITKSRTPTGTDLSFGNGFDLGVIGDILFHKGKSFLSLGSLLNALQDDLETSIVMTPKIIAQDGKTANIFSGQNIPYSGSVVQNQGNTTTLVTTNLEYRDIGMNLTITPILGNSDSVSLSINLESSQTASTDAGLVQLGQVNGITTQKTNMNTSIHIANKNFLVLSGMVTDSKTKTKSGIPCLGGLPIIGAAFSKNNRSQVKNNIVIILRPHIINSYKDMQNLSQIQEDSFREQTGSPTLEKDFDEAIEQLKSYENE